METLHIAHVLGVVCKDKAGNVLCASFRFECQSRRTIHLVWLKCLKMRSLNLLSATIHQDDEEMALLLHNLQK